MKILVVLTALAAALPLAVAPGAAAQGRLIVPIIVNPSVPPAGRTETRITVETPRTAGVGTPGAPSTPGGFASVPATSQEVRIISRPASAPASAAPNPAPPVRTRLIVEPSAASAGMASPSTGGGFASAPAFSRETRVQVQQDGGAGTPVTTQEIQIQSNGDVETPFVILPE